MTKQDYEIIKEFVLEFSIPTEFVQVARFDGMVLTIRTNEQAGHHLPHLHLETSDASLSIEIETQKILAATGRLSPAKAKKAMTWIREHQELLKRNWNEFSNGIKIEL